MINYHINNEKQHKMSIRAFNREGDKQSNEIFFLRGDKNEKFKIWEENVAT